MTMNRALGEGKVMKILKKYAYIQDERLGKIYFPLDAARITTDCVDLREKFSENDCVIFTAQRQTSPTNDCAYIASSVIKKKELVSCVGRITEVFDKFCYADVRKYGKVFVPYSARTESGKPWLGRGADRAKNCNLRIFRQPDINTCKYVAFGCDMALDDGLADELKYTGGSRLLDPSRLQVGCIVRYSDCGDCLVYSAQTGLARLPAPAVRPWMYMGGWLRYDFVRDASYVSNGSDGGRMGSTWLVRDAVDLGMLFPVEEDQMDGSRLQLTLYCVVNRVSVPNRQAWLWNDFIGRVYVPPNCFRHGIRSMDCVKVRIVYTGAFDDVPWSALSLEVIGANDEIRQANAQLLLTDDNWKITHVQMDKQTFFGFMENPSYGSAFIAWTDVADGVTPIKEQRCRATVFKQYRDKKHQWRAVLVAPLDDKLLPNYPLYAHTGCAILPRPFRPPTNPSTPPPPPPAIPQMPIGTRHERTMASVVENRGCGGPVTRAPLFDATNGGTTSPFMRGPASPLTLGPLVGTPSSALGSPTHVIQSPISRQPPHLPQRLPSLQQICPGTAGGAPSPIATAANSSVSAIPPPPGLTLPALSGRTTSPPPDGTASALSPSRLLSSDSSDTYSSSDNNREMDLLGAQFGGSMFHLPDEFSHWLPPGVRSGSDNGLRLPLSFPSSQSTSPAMVSKVDVGTQTEMISEQRVLRDIMQNRELLMKVFEAFPAHMDVILNMKWQSANG